MSSTSLGGRPLQVVHVVCSDAFSGVERYIVVTAIEMASRGLDVTVVGGEPTRMQAEMAGTAVRWYPAPSVRSALWRLWRLGTFDVVHAHMFEAELVAVLSRPRTGRIVVSTRHFAGRRGSSGPARLVGRVLTRLITTQLAISEFVAERVEGESVVVEPGVPSVEGSVPAADRQNIVLMVQRLELEKRGEVGIDAFAGSGLADRGWRLVIAGGGTDRERLESRCRDAGIAGSCDFLGLSSDVQSLYRRAAIFLATKPDEPFGLSVVEAMAAAVPVVAARGGGHLETVGKAPGAALFSPGDAQAAGELLVSLADDPVRRQRYGEDLCHLQREHFTIGRQVDQTIDIYQATQPERP